jgi:hypothetical protein
MPNRMPVCEPSRALAPDLPADRPRSAGPAPHDRLAGRYRFWRGASGRRAVFSAYALDRVPAYAGAVVIAVRRGDRGEEPVWIGAVETQAEADALPGLLAGLADMVHVHLLTATPVARRALVDDLAGCLRLH